MAAQLQAAKAGRSATCGYWSFLKECALRAPAGELTSGTLSTTRQRGPDLAGFAVDGGGSRAARPRSFAVGDPDEDFAGLADQRLKKGDRRHRQAWSSKSARHARRSSRRQGRLASRLAAGYIINPGGIMKFPATSSRSTRRSAIRRTSPAVRSRAGCGPYADFGHTRNGQPKAAVTTLGAILFHRRPTSASCTTARSPTTTTCAVMLEPRRHDLRDRKRHRGGRRLPFVAHASRG